MANDHKQVTIRSRKAWRSWLEKNHGQQESIWLIRYKKDKGPYVSYDDVVEEALCFGWIDSLPRKLDDKRTMLRLSPRKPKSVWSKVNKQRIARLKKRRLMTPAGEKAVKLAQKNGMWNALTEASSGKMPPGLKKALGQGKAMEYFQNFAPSAKRAVIEWITLAKKEETRKKRIKKTVDLAKKNLIANYPEGRNKGKPLPSKKD